MNKKEGIEKWDGLLQEYSIPSHTIDMGFDLDSLINQTKEKCAVIAERMEPRFANLTAIDINGYAKEHGKFIAKAIRSE